MKRMGELRALRVRAWLVGFTLLAVALPALAQRYGDDGGGRQARCETLEQQLVTDWRQGQDPRAAQQQAAQRSQELSQAVRRAEADAERRDCYEDMFIFGRSLKRTRECVDLDRQIEQGKRQLAALREQSSGGGRNASRMREDDLVAELAANGCGANYEREAAARRRPAMSSPRDFFSSFWQDEESGPAREDIYGGAREYRALPFATYRTLCVRSCDGYYYPISFATIQSRLAVDGERCASSCAAPAELYVYRNPGEQVEQMASLSGVPYAQMPNAFKNRKYFVRGCSCKVDEYSPEEIAKSEETIRAAAAGTGSIAPPGLTRGTLPDGAGVSDANGGGFATQTETAPEAGAPPVVTPPQ